MFLPTVSVLMVIDLLIITVIEQPELLAGGVVPGIGEQEPVLTQHDAVERKFEGVAVQEDEVVYVTCDHAFWEKDTIEIRSRRLKRAFISR
ncbi:hypothetical protein [Mariniradius sediminis]|uniref:Uncharacterized protein n=1 Tax=Mariniradius sediminis TaxID=2909237 RepID=A0ABS9BNS1_9BACT|nr:hypothetical protein [Mariniradius sediminis]MCF1749703.1 hypothetical protein [Mariniradius sediminis]